MAACGSLRHIFENTIVPENSSSSSSTSSLIDSLSPWNHIKTLKPPPDHSFTEIFGELHFKENHSNPASSSSSSFFPPPTSTSVSAAFPIDFVSQNSDLDKQKDEKIGGIITSFPTNDEYSRPYHRKSDSFSSLNTGSLQLCTEGLGSESLGDVEDLTLEVQNTQSHKVHVRRHSSDSYCRKVKTNGKTMFPPPIPYIGQAGKSSVSFQSYRENGRFVLREVRIPTQECLQASREEGRLRLSFVQSDDEEEDDDDDDNDNFVGDDGGEEEGEGEEEKGGVGRIEDEEEEEDRGGVEEDEAKVREEFVRSYS